MSDASPPWYVEAFRGGYLQVYAHRDDAAAAEEAAFAAGALRLHADDLVLDAGTGAGRHARALARLGARVVGLDLSLDLLRHAATDASEPASRVAYVRGDLLRLPFRSGSFSHVTSFFTSFGYFDEAGNRQQLAEVRRVLRPGGRYLLDFLNAELVTRSLVPFSERQEAGTRIVEERRIRAGRVEKDVRLIPPPSSADPERTWRESVRLYARDELEDLLDEEGLRPLAARGDLAGGPWSTLADRLVVVAEAR